MNVTQRFLQPFETRDAVVEAYARHVSPGKVAAYRAMGLAPVMGARTGAWFQDGYVEGRWMNCHCNGGVFNLGHRHPRVVQAVREALAHLDIGNHHLLSGLRARLAQRLSASTDHALPGVVFGVGGGEAVDLALKVARGVTGRTKIVSMKGGYHGHTGLAMAAGDSQYRDPFGPQLPGFIQVPFDDLEAAEAVVDSACAAVILEPIPATLGMPIPSAGYLKGIQALCRRQGAKLIVDEVQAGLGRTGRMWCYQHEGLQPDAVVTGKGLSGGIYPISATLLTREMHAIFDKHPFAHISTFGGAEPGCVAALEVLDIVEEPGFLERVNAVAAKIEAAFADLPFTLRHKGLMMGLAFEDSTRAFAVMQALFRQGVFCVYANNDPSVLQFLPPLILTDEEVNWLIERVRGVFR